MHFRRRPTKKKDRIRFDKEERQDIMLSIFASHFFSLPACRTLSDLQSRSIRRRHLDYHRRSGLYRSLIHSLLPPRPTKTTSPPPRHDAG